MQKYEEETRTTIEKYETVKGVNEQLQRKIEFMQKEADDKQNSLESMTQGRENLNAILGTKINFRKEGLRFNPSNMK